MTRRFGPGAIVAAAFIGPGTVTTCTLAGATFGYALLWALVFATAATVILQDMAARLGAGARLGLGEALMAAAPGISAKFIIGGLAFAAVGLGAAAYEAGNLAGGALGVEALMGSAAPDRRVSAAALAGLAAAALVIGEYKLLERLLIGLVMAMCAAFLLAALLVRPDLSAAARGFLPSAPDGSLTTTIALIGTTIVPYNLFLHAATAREKWAGAEDLDSARSDSALSIGIGGLISILIVSTAASSLFANGVTVESAADMARAIEPAFGPAAKYLIGAGLLGAGLTSAITAPMAAAYALGELLSLSETRRKTVFRATALAIVGFGAGAGLLGLKPISLILLAQYANGLLLPVIAGFLLYVMNRKSLLGDAANGPLSNLAGAIVLIVTIGLGARSVLRAAGIAP
ncbi:MAG: divalent metal cation transporter [Pseudomonadota bacterium]